MTRLVFTSDWHLGHANILRSTERSFASPNDMAEEFVRQTNRIARSEDRLFILGDLSFCCGFDYAASFVSQLRCRHKFLCFGNHDRSLEREWAESGLFEWTGTRYEFDPRAWGYHGANKIVCDHYPYLEWNRSRYNHEGDLSLNLHGHLHSGSGPGSYNEECKAQGIYRYDVGVDANGYAPVTLDEILAHFEVPGY